MDEIHLRKSSFKNPEFDLVCEELKRCVSVGRNYRIVKIVKGAFKSKNYIFLSGEETEMKIVNGKEVLDIVKFDVC